MHFNVTEPPTAQRTAQQIVEAFSFDTAPLSSVANASFFRPECAGRSSGTDSQTRPNCRVSSRSRTPSLPSFDYETNRVVPQNGRGKSFWQDKIARGPKLVNRGFLDQKMIPNLPEYPVAKKIGQGKWVLVEKFKKTPGAPKPKGASIRCYSSWDSYMRQVTLNLRGNMSSDLQSRTKRASELNR